MREIHTYCFLVDRNRPPKLGYRSTAGRYYVGAKDRKEAAKFLRESIKFGSITFICECNDVPIKYKQVFRVKFISGKNPSVLVESHSATSNHQTWKELI